MADELHWTKWFIELDGKWLFHRLEGPCAEYHGPNRQTEWCLWGTKLDQSHHAEAIAEGVAGDPDAFHYWLGNT